MAGSLEGTPTLLCFLRAPSQPYPGCHLPGLRWPGATLLPRCKRQRAAMQNALASRGVQRQRASYCLCLHLLPQGCYAPESISKLLCEVTSFPNTVWATPDAPASHLSSLPGAGHRPTGMRSHQDRPLTAGLWQLAFSRRLTAALPARGAAECPCSGWRGHS